MVVFATIYPMTAQKLTEALQKQAQKDWQTAKNLFNTKQYSYALFFGHLTLEKTLKVLIVKKTNSVYPPVHALNTLAQKAKIKLNKDQENELEEITTYNIKARYDDIKLSFYKKANKKYTALWMKKIEKYYLWLKKQF